MSTHETTLAFDIYGTLINPHGIADDLQEHVGDQALAFAQCWREKQLEYSFRRGLMQRYENFAVCTRHALEYTCEFLALPLSSAEQNNLMERYRKLPAFEGVAESLQALKQQNVGMYAFSNGLADDVKSLLDYAGISEYFDGIVSVDDVRSFKPDPQVYRRFQNEAGSNADKTWLISSNPFDIIGAKHAGWCAAWLNRDGKAVFDPWGVKPDRIINDLSELSFNK